MYRCEHCGSLCHVALVCGRCGKEHGPEFFKQADLDSKINSNFWFLFVLQIPLFLIVDIEYLIGLVILSIALTSIAAYKMAKSHKPKQITLKNGKTIQI